MRERQAEQEEAIARGQKDGAIFTTVREDGEDGEEETAVEWPRCSNHGHSNTTVSRL